MPSARIASFALALCLAATAFAQARSPIRAALDEARPGDVTLSAEGLVRDAYNVRIRTGLSLERSGELLARELTTANTVDLRLESVSESLTGRHARFRQYVDGVEVIGGELAVSADADGTIRELHNRLATLREALGASRISESEALAAIPATAAIDDVRFVAFNDGGSLRWAWRVVARELPLEPYEYLVDATNGALIRQVALFWTAAGRVFDPNPVAKLNDPALRDQNDVVSAVPDAAYSLVELQGLNPSGPLGGSNVQIAELERPDVAPVDVSQPLLFNRSQTGFEDVNAYFHIDRTQRYLQSLGYVGARRVVNRALRVDTHAAGGTDDSYYVAVISGQGDLYFGAGGTDDAEDSDIMLHEFGHALQDSIAPGAFLGTSSSEGRAIGEGFGDYWAFSSNYIGTVASGRDPYCIADWDARCSGDDPSERCTYPAGADCLRRVDGTKTMADYLISEGSTTPHQNGEIWSSALREIFVAAVARQGIEAGRRAVDSAIVEGTFGAPPSPTFASMARKLLQADLLLNSGANVSTICSAMTKRGILAAGDCDSAPKGEITILQTLEPDVAIPDVVPAGITSRISVSDTRSIDRVTVSVDIRHTSRGDLRIVLIAPDGTTVLLKEPANDPGPDVRVTYGFDAQPAQSLDLLHGKPAFGDWKLNVIDTRVDDKGRLLSWSLNIKYIGDEPLTSRPTVATNRLHIAAVGRTAGAEGTQFISDVRIFNGGSTAANVMVIFTPAGADGTTTFDAVRLVIAPQQTLALDDVVGRTFHAAGVGNLELQGDTSKLLVTSRTYNGVAGRTYGQFIPSAATNDAVALSEPPLFIPQLQNTDAFRTNIGFAEVNGGSGTVRVTLYDGGHQLLGTNDYPLLPYSQGQVAILGGRAGTHAEAVHAEVQVASGGARVIAYGSVVDNISGDPIYVPARRLSTAPAVSDIPAVLYSDGANNTRWRSDLWLTNGHAGDAPVIFTFRPAAGGPERSASTVVRTGETFSFLNVLAYLQQPSGSLGQLSIQTVPGVLATSRTWTTGDAGSFGQFIPARALDEAIGAGDAPRQTVQLESSAFYRTNVGAAEVAGQAVTLRFRVYNGAGVLIAQSDRGVVANGLMQFNLAEIGVAAVTNGRVSIEVTGGSGRVLGYASVVDNLSGDPIYIPAQ
jgi:subtilisin-like proprotein convertase family protein